MCFEKPRRYKYSFKAKAAWSRKDASADGDEVIVTQYLQRNALGRPELAARAVQRRLSFGLRISSKA